MLPVRDAAGGGRRRRGAVREGAELAPTASFAGPGAGGRKLAGWVKVDMKRPDKAEKCGHGTNIGFNIICCHHRAERPSPW
jgi:hypothetical protein